MRVRIAGRHRDAGSVALAAAVVSGFLVGWWAGRRSLPRLTPEGEIDPGWAEGWGDRVERAMDAAADGLRSVERRWRESRPLDPGVLERALGTVEGADRLRVSVLGEGVVEVVGDADENTARRAVAAVRAVPGVRAALDRVWTPSSANPGQIDAPPAFG